MAVEMPDRVRVAGLVYRVEVVSRGEESGLSSGFACVDHGRLRIACDQDVQPQRRRLSVIHELLHVLEHRAGCDLGESMVCMLACLLFAVLRDNPGLVAWLQDEEG